MALDPLPMNRCDHTARVIASPRFNRNPRPICIQGVRRDHGPLFALLDRCAAPRERERRFRRYMDDFFLAGPVPRGASASDRRSLRNGYLRFLRGWIHDASSGEGAVLKGWVESRFGIPPVYHAGRIDRADSREYLAYLGERMRGEARSNAVFAQFDLVYEYVQYELGRRHPGVPAFRLYRGIRNIGDYRFFEERPDGSAVVRMNNLNSFSSRLEYAWEFGSHVFEAEVPASKIFFRSDLLPGVLPKGEEESLVIGGDFEVTVRSY
ncbi:MAG: NAD(+)--dinitrogen-reductase ADP-D-ribosyltransferase [Thermodesulfobacteriota bacterium]